MSRLLTILFSLLLLLPNVAGCSLLSKSQDILIDKYIKDIRSDDPKRIVSGILGLESLRIEDEWYKRALWDVMWTNHGYARVTASWASEKFGGGEAEDYISLDSLTIWNIHGANTNPDFGVTQGDFEANSARMLTHGNVGERLDALDEIFWADNPYDSLKPLIVKAIGDEDARVRYMACLILGMYPQLEGPEAEDLVKAIDDNDIAVRAAAIAVTGKKGLGPDTVVPKLITIINDEAEPVYIHRMAILGLSGYGESALPARDVLSELMASSDESIRTAAIQVMVLLGFDIDSAIHKLLDELEGAEPGASYDLLTTLAKLDTVPEYATDQLMDLFKQKGSFTPLSTIDAIAKLKNRTEVVNRLIGMLQDDSTGDKSVLIRAIGRFGPDAKEAIPSLIKIAREPDGPNLMNAMISLGEIGPEPETTRFLSDIARELRTNDEAPFTSHFQLQNGLDEAINAIGHADFPGYINLMETGGEEIRERMVLSLDGFLEDAKPYVPSIQKILSTDPDARCRQAAARIIGQVSDSPEVIDSLINALSDPSEYVSATAIVSLGSIGPEASKAVPRIMELSNSDTQKIALNSIIALGGFLEDPEVMQYLLDIAEDKADFRNPYAVISISEYHPDDGRVLSLLIQSACDPNFKFRSTIMDDLKNYGEKAADAIPCLIEALDDEELQYAAINTLASMGSLAREAIPKLKEIRDKNKNSYESTISDEANEAITKIKGD